MGIIEQPVTFMRKSQPAGERRSGPAMKVTRAAPVTAPYHSGVVESDGTWRHRGFVYVAGSLHATAYDVDYDEAPIRKRLENFRPDEEAHILDLMIERQPDVRLPMETCMVDIVRHADIMDRCRRMGIEHIYLNVEAGDRADQSSRYRIDNLVRARHADRHHEIYRTEQEDIGIGAKYD